MILLPYQRAWLSDPAPLKIWLASRQIGKSFALSLEAVTEAIERKCNNLLLSSSERQSRELMRKVLSHLRVLGAMTGESFSATRITETEVDLPGGSRIISLPANADTVRGFSGNVFLDEFAFHQDSASIWRAMYPAVTRGYKVRVASTPAGMCDMFYDLWSGREGFSRHRTSIFDAVSDGLAVDVEALRRGIGDPDAWSQEYECAFVDSKSALISYELIARAEDDIAITGPIDQCSEIYLGVDIGHRRDMTVMWAFERVSGVMVSRSIIEMQGASFSAQRDALYALMDTGAVVRRCAIDASGIGAQMAEEAHKRYGHRVQPVVFTQASKEDMAITALRAFQDGRIRIPRSTDIRQDLQSVLRSATASGGVRFDAARTGGSHADRFWAMALALSAAGGAGSSPEPYYEGLNTRRALQRGW